MSHTRLAALALATTTLTAAGCGGSATKSNPAGAKTSAAQPAAQQSSRTAFIARADAICRQLNERAHTQLTVSLHTVGTTAKPLASYYRAAFAELRRLTPPAEIADAWRAIVSDVQRVPSLIDTMGRFALDNDMASTVKAELKVKKIQEHRFAIARRNGFTDCGE
jgi:hypothetical protein